MTARLEREADEVLAAATALIGIAVRSLDERAADLTLVQYRCLVMLAEAGPTPTTPLSLLVGVHQSTVTRATDSLVRRGLADKQRDAEDRRMTVIALTEAGAAVVASVMSARRELIRRVLLAMPRERAASVAAALTSFAAAADGAAGPDTTDVSYRI